MVEVTVKSSRTGGLGKRRSPGGGRQRSRRQSDAASGLRLAVCPVEVFHEQAQGNAVHDQVVGRQDEGRGGVRSVRDDSEADDGAALNVQVRVETLRAPPDGGLEAFARGGLEDKQVGLWRAGRFDHLAPVRPVVLEARAQRIVVFDQRRNGAPNGQSVERFAGVEGHRQKLGLEGQTFKKKVNESVLQAEFSVYFDPTLRRLGGTDLAGFYRYDDEGVKARRVAVVEHGILKTFLMARSPIEGFASSNGHGRAQLGLTPVARQSNLVVETAQPHSQAELKRMLIDEIKRENKPYGLLFDDIEGGFTITMRFIPNAFNVMPVMVYRVYPDGREELVRGVDFIGTPLTTFSKIVAADDRVAVFNGMCGAESGWVPVSAVSPGLLLSQVEVQKKLKSGERPPILPPPIGPTATP